MSLNLLQRLKPEEWAGLSFVLILHGAALYTLWSFRIIPTPEEAMTVMVNFISPPAPEQPASPKPPKQQQLKPVAPPKPQQLVAATPVVAPDEPAVYVPPPPPPVVEAPPLPPQPVVLSGELSVICPERSPPDYPSLSMRMNEQGKVILRVELENDGHVVHSEVKTSSGYQRLDDAALSAVKTWHCKPAMKNGIAVHAVALQPFNFILEGR